MMRVGTTLVVASQESSRKSVRGATRLSVAADQYEGEGDDIRDCCGGVVGSWRRGKLQL